MSQRSLALFGLVALTAACGGSEPAPPAAPQPTTAAMPPPAASSAAPEASAAPASSAAPAAEAPKAPTPAARWTGLATPESVFYDEARDRYLVSNINGKPGDADNNGFISELSPDGTVKTLKLIEGGKNKVT